MYTACSLSGVPWERGSTWESEDFLLEVGGIVQDLEEVWACLTCRLVLDLSPLSSTALARVVLDKW